LIKNQRHYLRAKRKKNQTILLIIVVIAPISSFADEITTRVHTCGSQLQSDFGIVFQANPLLGGQFYFAKGNAMEVCPKITKAREIVGLISSYCEYLKSNDPECKKVKVFTITDIINE